MDYVRGLRPSRPSVRFEGVTCDVGLLLPTVDHSDFFRRQIDHIESIFFGLSSLGLSTSGETLQYEVTLPVINLEVDVSCPS